MLQLDVDQMATVFMFFVLVVFVVVVGLVVSAWRNRRICIAS